MGRGPLKGNADVCCTVSALQTSKWSNALHIRTLKIRKLLQMTFAPWELILSSNLDVAVPSNSTNDFRLNIVERLTPGTVIYMVYGRPTANFTDALLIGELVSDSEFIASEYGDTLLFFRHPSLQWRPLDPCNCSDGMPTTGPQKYWTQVKTLWSQ